MPKTINANKWLFPLAVIFLALSCWLAFDMLRLTAARELWGYRPFFLYLFAWGAIVTFIGWNKQRRGQDIPWRKFCLSALSGFILAFSFPGLLPFPWLSFIGFIPLFILHRELEGEREQGRKQSLFPYAYQSFFLWNALATFWVTNTALAAGLFAVVVNSLLMCIPVLLFQRTVRVLPRFGYVSFIAYWLSFEYLHMQWDLSWPWLTLGNVFAQMHPTVQWYEYTGVFGGSLWILGLNVLLFRLWEQRQAGAAISLRRWIGAGALILLPILISLLIYYTYHPSEETRNVLLVQTNFEPHYDSYGGGRQQEQIDIVVDQIRNGLQANTDFVVLPETVFDSYGQRSRLNEYRPVEHLREALSSQPGLALIFGLSAYHILATDEPHTRATKERTDVNGRSYFLETYNAAAQFIIGTDEVQFYKKSKLVPGAESFPFPWLFFFMEPVVEQLGGTTGGFGAQLERTPMVSTHGRVAPVICYESIYGEYFGGYVRQGAQAAFIMTNDGWWDNTPGHLQHLYFASLRAIETRRSIGRAANVGNSAFINERGDRVQEAQYNEAVTLNGQITLNDKLTFYVKWGDLIARIALFLALLLLVGMVAQQLKQRLEND
ncbi:MAG: apolipoprotein N-acyltransferase [Saprospiraceae bacterium]|nr:apolipoprotein N-acyltransferase [Lewinella sp.]